ncbi:hypothetical protein Pmar_PMAR019174 [Perkinsus marinus ATCC 50983]|uniref:Uncharacterized protein n=1 Tax=Perkinsus marinus (strain ATCC 50983 / TXsc) TaxID=423536 RepID=C5KU27_PERM5|nr:hypothetical protein Pmar_PMAR019174 [Perkinsus marinus ATCC 50983]EER12069.1 hypothetical protein Pmar_PMAR019174 [Perkinsus marinus ATCC 50983]|eukprot:XP_002780274.1 hypothetical protein Pmar_PMAR019174 [Perkinsus marinus ATCC 50983]
MFIAIVTLYICADASGEQIRAYSPEEVVDTIPSHVAAACLQQSSLLQLLDKGEPCTLFDPFLHSTSLCLEAAAMISGTPPGSPAMEYPFTQFPTHDHMEYSSLVDDISVTPHEALSNVTIIGSSADVEVVARAKREVEAFRRSLPRRVVATEAPTMTSKYGTISEFLSDTVVASREGRAAADDDDDAVAVPRLVIQRRGSLVEAGMNPPGNCMVVTHIPRRPRKENRDKVYQDFGRMILSNASKWRAVMVIVSEEGNFESQSGLEWNRIFSVSHGGQRFSFLQWSGKKRNK